jgi:hypothetical protein
LSGRVKINLAANTGRYVGMIESLTDELGLCYTSLAGSPFQHSIVARFNVDLLPNHGP